MERDYSITRRRSQHGERLQHNEVKVTAWGERLQHNEAKVTA